MHGNLTYKMFSYFKLDLVHSVAIIEQPFEWQGESIYKHVLFFFNKQVIVKTGVLDYLGHPFPHPKTPVIKMKIIVIIIIIIIII